MSERLLFNEDVNAALRKYTQEIARTAAMVMWDRLGCPPLDDDGGATERLDLFGKHWRPTGDMVTGYAMEIDTSIAGELLDAIATALPPHTPPDSAVEAAEATP